jgi:hypothetical protein
MLTNETARSFALALYRSMNVVEPPHESVTFEKYEPALTAYVVAYFNYDGKLPYNGFDSAKFFMDKAGVPEEVQHSLVPPSDRKSMAIQDAILMELCRIWLELSGLVDATYKIH